jgi:hypothetical protein
MSNISDQKVVVICDFTDTMKDVIVHGIRIADILKKELCLLAFWKDKNQKSQMQEKLILTTRKLKSNLPNQLISSLLLQSSLRDNMAKLVDNYNAILVVLHQSNTKTGLKAFRESTIAFLFVNGSLPEFLTYKNVLVPVDCRKSSKEASLWPSYLGRFNQSMVHLLCANDTEPDQVKMLKNNMSFIQKFFMNLNVRHRFIAGKSTSWGIFNETLTNASGMNADVMTFAGSTYITFLDLLIGLPEEKIIRKAGNLPILIINPRKDMCILCD